MLDDDIFYFAYGSNLDRPRKEARTGRIREAKKARLLDYRLAFNKKATHGGVFANIVPHVGSVVWGVVYRCRPDSLDELDKYEGVSSGDYERIPVVVELADSTTVQAITYTACEKSICAEGIPSKSYLRLIMNGARGHCLPNEYIEQILKLAGGQDHAMESNR